MKILQIYDNGDESFDRYTVVFTDTRLCPLTDKTYHESLGLSHNPTDPQGFSQWGDCINGDHLGKKIDIEDLPENVREHLIDRTLESVTTLIDLQALFGPITTAKRLKRFLKAGADILAHDDCYAYAENWRYRVTALPDTLTPDQIAANLQQIAMDLTCV